ncbi:MAG: G8 domain-containing protein [Pseudomonadota bacterium]
MIPRNNETVIDRHNLEVATGLLSVWTEAVADVVATASGGLWSDPATWVGGAVPTAGQRVSIPRTAIVHYDLDSTVVHGWVRVDGCLKWMAGTSLIVDTIIGSRTSYIEIGTPASPIPKTAPVDVIFKSGAYASGDTHQFSRGLITVGRVMIHGEEILPYAYVDGFSGTSFTIPDQINPSDGAVLHTGASIAATWRVGDVLCLPDQGDMSVDYLTRTITGITGATVTVDTSLDLASPGERTPPSLGHALPMHPFIANESRSIRFSSQDPSGIRGHTMFARGRFPASFRTHLRRETHRQAPDLTGAEGDPGVFCAYAAFIDLGRTTTTEDPAPGAPTNPTGRYPVHIHSVGHWSMQPAYLIGCHLTGNPGWGYVHDDSHAYFWRNTGRGMSATTPDGGGGMMVCDEDTETGVWSDNMMYCCRGDRDPSVVLDEQRVDGHGHAGVGFVMNRMVRLQRYIAINCRAGVSSYQTETDSRGPKRYVKPVAVDRTPDREAIRRHNHLSSPVASYRHEDHQFAGWVDGVVMGCKFAWYIFHRQLAFYANDYHSLFARNVIYQCERTVEMTNYVLNYMFRDNVFFDAGTIWRMGDKTWGLVFAYNHVEDCFAWMTLNGSSANNAAGGVVGNVFINSPSTAPNGIPYPLLMENQDPTGWITTPAFSAQLVNEPFAGTSDFIEGLITDGFTGNLPINEDGSKLLGHAQYGPRPMGFGARPIPFDKIPIRNARSDLGVGHTLTVHELVEQQGCFYNGSNWVVRLDFPYRDRLRGTLHYVTAYYNVDVVPLALRQANDLGGDPGAPTPVAEIVPEPNLATPESYAVFPDPTHEILYVCQGTDIHVDQTQAFGALLAGQSDTFSRTFSIERGQDTTTLRRTFTISGAGAAPAMVSAPRLHDWSADDGITSFNGGSSEFSSQWIPLDKGEWSGFPQPTITCTMEKDGVEDTTGRGQSDFLVPAWGSTDGPHATSGKESGSFRFKIVAANEHGSVTAYTNSVTVT